MRRNETHARQQVEQMLSVPEKARTRVNMRKGIWTLADEREFRKHADILGIPLPWIEKMQRDWGLREN